MKAITTIIILFCTTFLFSQSTISGKVVDQKGKPISGANVFIEGSYDGATTNESGSFSFTTDAIGNQILVVSFLIYETSKTQIDVANFQAQTVKLKDSMNALDAVVISAGTMESGEKARVSVLKPLDIVTTAGSAGNIIAALQTLPGTQSVGEDGRLFVRGGEANETQTFVDGIRVAQPYGATTNNLPTRGRFSPFLFSGIAFSTGGYSAEYGEALSSVLLLNTEDNPDQNKTDISLMTVGLGLGNTQKWKKSSLSVNASYINLVPYQAAVPQNVDWNSPFQSLSGETVYRYNFNNGILKLYAAFDSSKFDINQENINSAEKMRVNLKNDNFYFNTSYKGNFGTNWQIITGMSYGYSKNKIGLDLNNIANDENAAHLKLKLKKNISNYFKLSFGGDYFSTKFDESFTENLGTAKRNGYNSNIAAAYAEGDILFSKKFAAKIGLRASNNDLLDETTISPRISMAYKVAKNSQFSLAYGDFTQSPNADYIKYSKYHQFESEKASHYILNFQYAKDDQTFRAEAYYKDYSNLVKYDTQEIAYNSIFNNQGSAYVKGMDLFWRDGKSIKNLEYWISYSYIDTERDYKNYPTTVTPSFVADHSLSVVTKYFITDWRSQIGFTNSFSSGRPYNNPNETQFMNGKAKAYNSLSFNWAYLIRQQKILYFSVSNVLGTQNIFGYDYANSPDSSGFYKRKEITPTADRFFFVGFFWTISKDKKDNQLKNL
ncbi:TonB-dependent receptor [Flavobacterium frigoris]|uniref:Outer membrane receptor protein n=1 Tax=Flavobacterium frigoris (strain PS1) TaxID=1086011 RepID=H7FSI6_FLAFP|nr:TonB-dependent receptor [Flavobacterium frigoris]EIA08262.1 putative outer membrane receptor protein [Flavobacterium frigoris PS1]